MTLICLFRWIDSDASLMLYNKWIKCFFFLSNTFRVKRSPKKTPLSNPSEVCVILHSCLPASSYRSHHRHLLLYSRMLSPQRSPRPTCRMTMPRTKRSWPPPPLISGRLCMMQIWALCIRIYLSPVTSHLLLTTTVFLLQLQVRLSRLMIFVFFILKAASTCIQTKV